MICFRRVNALLTKYLYITVKTIDRIADVIFWPVIAVFLWGFVSTFLQTGYKVNLIELILAGFIFYQFFQRCQTDIPLYLLEDFWSNNLQNTFSTPVTKWEKLTSLIIFAVIKASFTLVITYIVALLMFKFDLLTIHPLYLVLYTFSLLLFAIGFGIFLAGVIFRYGTGVQVIAWSTSFMLQPLMAVFYPVSILPDILQSIAKMIPATYVFEGLRQIRMTGIFNSGDYTLSLILDVVFICVGCLIYSWGFNYNKKNGKLVQVE